MFDECMPVAGAIAYQLLSLGRPGAASAPELEVALAKGNDALAAVALRALAAYRSPAAVPSAVRLLGDDDVTCRWAALDVLSAMGPSARAATPALVNALERGPWDVRARVATLLGELGDPRAIDPLHRAIGHSPASAQATSARALAQFRGAARAAAPELEQLAAEHWSWPVRRAAADAAWALSGKQVAPRVPSCRTHEKNAAGRWSIEWNSRELELLPIEVEIAQTFGTGPCAGLRSTVLIAGGDTCIVGESRGEWGGSLLAVRGSERRVLRAAWDTNPLRAVRLGSVYLVVEGLDHLGSNTGIVTRVSRGPKGAWEAEPLVELAGMPIAFATTDAGALLLLTGDASRESGCPEEPGVRAPHRDSLVRIDSDGSVRSLP
jgi:hypothetical protein